MGSIKKKKTETKQTSSIAKAQNLCRGIFRMNPKGFGFVIPEDPLQFPQDIFVPKHLTNSAIDGDLVEVELLLSTKKDKGPEGGIVSVLQRGRASLGGTVCFIEPPHGAWIYAPLLGPNKLMRVEAHEKKLLKKGDRVLSKVLDWGGVNKPLVCEIEQILGSITDPSIDILAATEEFHIARDFPKDVLIQAQSFGKTVTKKDQQNRLDLTKTECLTIDPTTAKDFDDALSIIKDSKGLYHLGVHIADVSHYVQSGTPLDLEARRRANSTYFPGACIPMLPEELSNHLCSLKPKVVRLCLSVLMTFDEKGTLLQHEITRSFIKSAKRFTYEEAKQVLDGKKKSVYKPSLDLMVQLGSLLKQQRAERGCVDFSLPEVVLDIQKNGEPTSYHIVEYDITHQLVEEFMLKANELVAFSLYKKEKSLIFRVHEQPSEENRDGFFAFARSLGFSLQAKPGLKDIQKLFLDAAKTPFAEQLSISFIRSMKLASYSQENVGHYGLSLEHYCHFTSPIRRYPDLVVHRLLFEKQQEDAELQKIAKYCSEQERVSFKAEQSVKTLKKLRLVQKWHEKNPDAIYRCLVTKIKPFALYFELPPISVEGSLHVSELGGDYFIYEAEMNAFIGRKTQKRFTLGDVIEMKISTINLILQEITWERILDNLEEPRRPSKKHKKRR